MLLYQPPITHEKRQNDMWPKKLVGFQATKRQVNVIKYGLHSKTSHKNLKNALQLQLQLPIEQTFLHKVTYQA